jgi:hypothetical protein
MNQSNRERRVRRLYSEWPPEVILRSRSVAQFDQLDFERSRWVWERRPARDISAVVRVFLRRLVCILVPTAAVPFLPPLLSAVLGLACVTAGGVLAFLSIREMDKWAKWRSDYSRTIDRLVSRGR